MAKMEVKTTKKVTYLLENKKANKIARL